MGLITHPHNQSNWGITKTLIQFILKIPLISIIKTRVQKKKKNQINNQKISNKFICSHAYNESPRGHLKSFWCATFNNFRAILEVLRHNIIF